MKLKVQSIHFDADKKLIEFIQERVDKLIHYYEDIIDGEVFLKLDNSSDMKNKITEIRLKTPGKILFAKQQCRSFEEATDNAVEALRKQITRHKEKVRGV
ncbi:MAG: ribosome-associated translation inhibitor RaiA [Bacteroidetes bacterium]|nr:ribosome-associated translation inhibitor RaiA [Bacteroidota bacterium]